MMRNRWISGCVTAGVLALAASVPALPHAQAAAAGLAAPAQGRGRGAPPAVDADGNRVAGRGAARPAPPSKPTPRLPDGRVNFGAPAGEKGFWNNGVGS